jgi:Cu-Zn family superoxide dismutase
MLAQNGRATVWAFKVPDEVAELAENFADGKKPGRKDLAKRSCPRTRATECQCKSVNKLSESQETITAVCVLEHSDKVKGTLLFKQQAGGPTLIVGKITGLTPGEHGFHIHEFGDLSNGCESAGPHYNPDGVDHGDLDEGHVGDLGNVTADDNGVANISIVAKRVDLTGERSVVGRAVVIHSDEDDLGQGGDEESLKTGNAGDRLACGVITLRENIEK